VLSKVDISVAVVSSDTSDVVVVVSFVANGDKYYYNHHIRCS
jgi:hypothetical protein